MTTLARLATWIAGHDTGISSIIIAAQMCGANMAEIDSKSTPSDPSDLGRCLRLLDVFPEWEPRMGEMAQVSQEWADILPYWDAAAAMMAEEVGIDWSSGRSAPKTYEFMKAHGFGAYRTLD